MGMGQEMVDAVMRAVLVAVEEHPNTMSHLAVAMLLTGSATEPMRGRGLDESPFFGVFENQLMPGAAQQVVRQAIAAGYLAQAVAPYPALTITALGQQRTAAYRVG